MKDDGLCDHHSGGLVMRLLFWKCYRLGYHSRKGSSRAHLARMLDLDQTLLGYLC